MRKLSTPMLYYWIFCLQIRREPTRHPKLRERTPRLSFCIFHVVVFTALNYCLRDGDSWTGVHAGIATALAQIENIKRPLDWMFTRE